VGIPSSILGSFYFILSISHGDKQSTKAGELAMREGFPGLPRSQAAASEMGLFLESDFLKAAYVFRRWKNLLFFVLLLCLLLNQASFWLVITGQVEGGTIWQKDDKMGIQTAENTKTAAPVVLGADSLQAGRIAAPAEKSTPMAFGLDVTLGI
jgi:hypothetical protein